MCPSRFKKNAGPEILVVLKFPFSLLLYFSHLSVGWKLLAGKPETGMVQPVGPAAKNLMYLWYIKTRYPLPEAYLS